MAHAHGMLVTYGYRNSLRTRNTYRFYTLYFFLLKSEKPHTSKERHYTILEELTFCYILGYLRAVDEYSGVLCYDVVHIGSDVSEELATSIFRLF
jgi:hypothetical protein